MAAIPTTRGRTRRTQEVDSGAKAFIDERHLMAGVAHRRAHILQPQRLHPKERPEAKTLIPRVGPDQQDFHGNGPIIQTCSCASIQAHAHSLRRKQMI